MATNEGTGDDTIVVEATDAIERLESLKLTDGVLIVLADGVALRGEAKDLVRLVQGVIAHVGPHLDPNEFMEILRGSLIDMVTQLPTPDSPEGL